MNFWSRCSHSMQNEVLETCQKSDLQHLLGVMRQEDLLLTVEMHSLNSERPELLSKLSEDKRRAIDSKLKHGQAAELDQDRHEFI